MDVEEAASLLRAFGWTCLPPPTEELPPVEVGQVWISPNPKVEPRTVTAIGRNNIHRRAGMRVVYFTTPLRRPYQTLSGEKEPQLDKTTFLAWARKANARPALTP